jgi:hypothetical protein
VFVHTTKKRKKMKQTHSQSSPDGFVENTSHNAAKSPDLKQTCTAPDNCNAEEEEDWDQVCGIIQALQAKPKWQHKVAAQAVVTKWCAKALAQGTSPQSVTKALTLLLQEAVVGTNGMAGPPTLCCTLSFLSAVEHKRMVGGDHNFRCKEDDKH